MLPAVSRRDETYLSRIRTILLIAARQKLSVKRAGLIRCFRAYVPLRAPPHACSASYALRKRCEVRLCVGVLSRGTASTLLGGRFERCLSGMPIQDSDATNSKAVLFLSCCKGFSSVPVRHYPINRNTENVTSHHFRTLVEHLLAISANQRH